MKLLFALIVASFVIAPQPLTAAPAAKKSEPRIARVEAGLLPPILWKGEKRSGAALAQRMTDYKVPGLSIAVVDGYEIAWAKSWGVVRAGATTPVTDDTLFQAGSVSKTVSAMLALRLVANGTIALDDPVNSRLTSWKLPDSVAGGAKPVTIRHLLSHSAGLNPVTYIAWDPSAPAPRTVDLLDGKGIESARPVVRVEPPGERFAYSNPAYLMLQQLVTDVSRKPFEDVARAELFAPAGMTASAFAPLPPPLLERAAWGHDTNGAPLASKGLVVPAAIGGLWTTPSDLARLQATFFRGFRGRDGGLLPLAVGLAAITPHAGTQGLVGVIEGDGTARHYTQVGGMPGFTTYVVGYPQLGRGAVLMANGGINTGALLREIARAIAVEYAWPGYIDEYERDERPADTFALAGDYELDQPQGFIVHVTMKDGELFWAERRMIAVKGGFFVVPDAGVRVSFVTDSESGAVTAAEFGPPGARQVRARRVR